MSEENNILVQKPKKLWNDALKMVKGENTTQLIEQFTAEMTLVAEGLCEDQSKLRREVDSLISQDDRRIQKLESRIDFLETTLEEERQERDRNLTEARNRLASLEKKTAKPPAGGNKTGIIRGLTVIVSIAAAAWVIVTVINKFF